MSRSIKIARNALLDFGFEKHHKGRWSYAIDPDGTCTVEIQSGVTGDHRYSVFLMRKNEPVALCTYHYYKDFDIAAHHAICFAEKVLEANRSDLLYDEFFTSPLRGGFE